MSCSACSGGGGGGGASKAVKFTSNPSKAPSLPMKGLPAPCLKTLPAVKESTPRNATSQDTQQNLSLANRNCLPVYGPHCERMLDLLDSYRYYNCKFPDPLAMELYGHTQNATYLTGPKVGSTFLPTIGNQTSSYKVAAAPSYLTRSSNLPWRPSTYYMSAQIRPAISLVKSAPEPLSTQTQMTALDDIKVPSVFTAARNSLYTRYTPNEWTVSNSTNYLASDRVRAAAERLRADAHRLSIETDDRTKKTQSDVGRRLGERVGDITFWKTELQNETDQMVTEINNLLESKRILERALAETENPLHISQECLYNREKRQAIDLVHDHVEKELIKEVDVIKKCQELMRHTIEKANRQLALNRAAQHELEKDTGDKYSALGLDATCHTLRNSSRGINYHHGVQNIDNTVSVPETWAKFSHNNIQRSQSERAASVNMRNEIENVLNQCANEMWNQWNAVNVAFTARIAETTEARDHLQHHLSRVLQEIFDMEKNIEMLKKAIEDKANPMQVSQTRLETRLRRPNVEACRDPPMNRLISEVGEITESIEYLTNKLRESENALQHLLRTKATLEQDLAVKNNSLFIDREKCMGMRKVFPLSPKVASY